MHIAYTHTHTHTRGHKEPISVGRWRAQLLRCPGNTYEFLSLSSITPAAAWYRRTGRSSPWENREREREIASTTDRTARLFSHYLNEHWRVNVGVGHAKSLFSSSLCMCVCSLMLLLLLLASSSFLVSNWLGLGRSSVMQSHSKATRENQRRGEKLYFILFLFRLLLCHGFAGPLDQPQR